MTSSLGSQRMERILLQAMEEVLGEQGLRSVFQAAHVLAGDGAAGSESTGILWPESRPIPFGAAAPASSFVGCTLAAFEDVYGNLAGRGLALRVGRALFAYGLREYGAELGLTGAAFRLLPFPNKLRTFGSALAQLFNEADQKRLEIEEQKGRLLVHLLRCPFCLERPQARASCELAAGLAEESLYWLSGGKIFEVDAIACAERGDAGCTLQIEQAPIFS